MKSYLCEYDQQKIEGSDSLDVARRYWDHLRLAHPGEAQALSDEVEDDQTALMDEIRQKIYLHIQDD